MFLSKFAQCWDCQCSTFERLLKCLEGHSQHEPLKLCVALFNVAESNESYRSARFHLCSYRQLWAIPRSTPLIVLVNICVFAIRSISLQGHRNGMETYVLLLLLSKGGGKRTREKGTCRSGRLLDIVIHFWMDRADHDIQLVSNSAGTFSTCPDTTTVLTDYAFALTPSIFYWLNIYKLDRNLFKLEMVCMETYCRYGGGGKKTREKGTCQSGRLSDIVIHFWTTLTDYAFALTHPFFIDFIYIYIYIN